MPTVYDTIRREEERGGKEEGPERVRIGVAHERPRTLEAPVVKDKAPGILCNG